MSEIIIFLLLIAIMILGIFSLFIVKKSNDFLVAIKNTKTYEMILTAALKTIVVLAVIVTFSYILPMLNPDNFEIFSFQGAVFIIWALLLLLGLTSLFRCAYLFVIIFTAKNKRG